MEAKGKRETPRKYDDAFKEGAIRPVTEQGRPSREVAQELGICTDTLCNWLKVAGLNVGQTNRQNRDTRRTKELEAEIRTLRKQIAEKDEVIDVLKKLSASSQSHRKDLVVIMHGSNAASAVVNNATVNWQGNSCACTKNTLQWGWTAFTIF